MNNDSRPSYSELHDSKRNQPNGSTVLNPSALDRSKLNQIQIIELAK